MPRRETDVPAESGVCARFIDRLAGCFYRPSVRHRTGRGVPSWRRIVAAGGALLLAGYLGTATAAFVGLRYARGVEVRYADVLWPGRWTKVRVALGQQAIREAQSHFAAGRYREALVCVRSGLARAPLSRDGRLLDFQLELAARQPERARAVLLAGLDAHCSDAEYVRATLTFLLRRQEDAHVIALYRRYAANPARNLPTAGMFALAAATASHLRGGYDQAEDFIRLAGPAGDARDAAFLRTKIEWDRGNHAAALAQLRRLADAAPDDAAVHHELIERLRTEGGTAEARRLSVQYQIAHPQLAEPRIELLEAYRDAREPEHIAREAAALLRDFATDPAALQMLAEFAAMAGDVSLAGQVMEVASTQRLGPEPFALLVMEARIVARDYHGALDAMREFEHGDPERLARYRPLLSSLQGVANLGLADPQAARVYFTEFLNQPNLRAENLLAIANRCVALDHPRLAREILARATEVDHLNQAALTRLVELELDAAMAPELPAHLRRLLTMRRPPMEIIRVARRKLGSDMYLFVPDLQPALEAVGAALRAGDPVTPYFLQEEAQRAERSGDRQTMSLRPGG